jgi:hypothetical protein
MLGRAVRRPRVDGVTAIICDVIDPGCADKAANLQII